MAEFCLKCFNELNGTDYRGNEIWLEEDFCEGCADWLPCVMELRPKPLLWRLFDLVRGPVSELKSLHLHGCLGIMELTNKSKGRDKEWQGKKDG